MVGTDVFHAALLLWVAGVAHVVSGNVDFGLMGNILIGSIPGVWIGTHFIDRVPAHGAARRCSAPCCSARRWRWSTTPAATCRSG